MKIFDPYTKDETMTTLEQISKYKPTKVIYSKGKRGDQEPAYHYQKCDEIKYKSRKERNKNNKTRENSIV